MEQEFAIKITEVTTKIVIVTANNLADGILKVQNMYDKNEISLSNEVDKDVSISGYNVAGKDLTHLKEDPSVLDLTNESIEDVELEEYE